MQNRPVNPYDPEWLAYWAQNPGQHRAVGAEVVAEGESEGETSPPASAGGNGTVAEWASGIQNEGLKSALGQFDTQDAFFQAAGIKAPEAPEPTDWRAELPDDLKKTADRFATPADAMRSIIALQKREGQIRVPSKNATDEERAAYHKAIGVPAEPSGYEFPDLPEGMEVTDEIKASREVWAKRFHELKVSKDVASELTRLVNEDAAAQVQAQLQADKAFAQEQEDKLRSEWKGDWDKNVTLADRALTEIANRAGVPVDDLRHIEMKDGRFLLDNAPILRMFSVIAHEMAEGTIGPMMSQGEIETAEEQLRDLRKQIDEAQAEGNSKRANQLYQREQALITKMQGSQKIVGSAGRVA